MGAPLWDLLFPEDGAIEGVACDEHEFGWHENGNATALIHDVEEATARTDFGGDGRHAVMVARPAGVADPLHALGRTDNSIF